MSNALASYEEELEPERLSKLLDRLKVRYNTLDNMHCDVAPANEAEEKGRMAIDERYFDAVIAAERYIKQSQSNDNTMQFMSMIDNKNYTICDPHCSETPRP